MEIMREKVHIKSKNGC